MAKTDYTNMKRATKSTRPAYDDYIIPGIIMDSEKYRGMTNNAKLLYATLLHLLKSSEERNWVDDQGYLYVIFSIDEACGWLHCARATAVKTFKELEECNLIIRARNKNLDNVRRIYVREVSS